MNTFINGYNIKFIFHQINGTVIEILYYICYTKLTIIILQMLMSAHLTMEAVITIVLTPSAAMAVPVIQDTTFKLTGTPVQVRMIRNYYYLFL